MDDVSIHRHEGHVGKEALASFPVGLLHEFQDNSIGKDLTTFLRILLGIRPVFLVWQGRSDVCSVFTHYGLTVVCETNYENIK